MSSLRDETAATHEGLGRAAAALGADAAAVVRCDAVVASVGWPAGAVPVGPLMAAAREGIGEVPGPSGRRLPARTATVEGDDAVLVVVRALPLDAAEEGLLIAMAHAIGLAVRLLRGLEAERYLRERTDVQGRELHRRARMLQSLSAIERATVEQAPLDDILHAVAAAAAELLDGEPTAVLLADPDDAGSLRLAAQAGLGDADRRRLRRVIAGRGAGGRAFADDRLVVLEGAAPAIAAPVHESGGPAGCLLVASPRAGRTFTAADREAVVTLARHASLAIAGARTRAAMAHQALHDPLTGLPNRALFRDRLDLALARAQRRGGRVGLLFFDLDDFKTVNDSLGHATGDALLAALAGRLRGCVRQVDTVARLGGDAFAILLDDDAHAERIAERVLDTVRRPIVVDGREIVVNASVGIAAGAGPAADLLRAADLAMYGARASGPGRITRYEPGMGDAAAERMALKNDLRRAVAGVGIELHYQPIVVLDGARLAGFEALARWRHPERGLLGPQHFISLAEDIGAIVALGRNVLAAACRQAAAWGVETISVNLSARQLDDEALARDVRAALRDAGLAPERLVVEVSETALVRHPRAAARLHELRDVGVRIAIDDFGTGSSSLRVLPQLPVDVLKMGKPFVDGLGDGGGGDAMAAAIVELAASLGLAVVAEGIERPEQAAALLCLGCEYGQGFLYSRPLSAAAAGAALRDRARASGGRA